MSAEAAGAAIGSFLTEDQRKALDAALAEKAAENAALAKANAHHHIKNVSGDRKSKHGKGTGAPKKNGGGGKFTWGNIYTNGDTAERILDRNDPNYDSDEERNMVVSQHSQLKEEIRTYKQEVQSIVEEYFESGDIAEVADSLEDLGAPEFMHYFVKRVVMLALDRKDREREMASVLLSSLYAEVIPPEQVQKGFMNLIDGLSDTILDVPDAADLLALFISRAVVDDVLPPAIASRIPEVPELTGTLRHKVEAHVTTRHSAEKILRCWGSGAGLNYQDTKDSIARILNEFQASFDSDEAARCLRALSVPFFHHEFVKQAVHAAMSGADPQREALVGLLGRMCSSGEVSSLQLAKGLRRVSDNLEDLALDNPAAKQQYDEVHKLIKAAKLLEIAEGAIPDPTLSPRLDNGSTASSTGGASVSAALNNVHSVAAFKAASAAALLEYFDSSDASEVARRLRELDDPGLLHIMVKQAVTMALDRKDRERELVSNLISELTPQVLAADQVSMGFTRLLGAADDLVLDCPDAVHLLSLFLGRAIVDEVLPPSFLAQVLQSLRAEGLGISVVKATGALLSARHGAERVTNCWHGGALTLEQIKEQIKTTLREYTTNLDLNEASKCLVELGVSYFHHEVVVEALELAFEQEQCAEGLLSLLAALAASGVINQTQMSKGFSRVRSRLDEEAMDYGPKARDMFSGFVQTATQQGWLTLDVEA
mmetsp:Transcript_36791/g.81831  ORF Transcript_36791/g.81831 Transcript_36791/m.81831 type:complete len:712 (-) Transcript_36791:320-2455(-)